MKYLTYCNIDNHLFNGNFYAGITAIIKGYSIIILGYE